MYTNVKKVKSSSISQKVRILALGRPLIGRDGLDWDVGTGRPPKMS